MLSLVEYPWLMFPVVFAGLLIFVESGFLLRRASSDVGNDRQSAIESARDGLTLLLSFLLGFSLPIAGSYYEQRTNLVVQEANAIATVDQRAQMLPEPASGQILQALQEYVDVRMKFAAEGLDQRNVDATLIRTRDLQKRMWEESVEALRDDPNPINALFAQALSALPDISEQRQAAMERRVPGAVWLLLVLIAALACSVVGYSMRARSILTMLVLPLTVAIVLSLVADLDSPRAGFIHIEQQTMQRLRTDLRTESVPTHSSAVH